MNRWSSLRFLLAMALVTSCKTVQPSLDAGADAGAAFSKTFTLHYHRALSDYDGWVVSATEGSSAPTTPSIASDAFGAVYELALADDAPRLSFTLARGAVVDAADLLTVDLTSGAREAWVISGLAKALTRQPLALPTPTQFALYYQRPDALYAGYGLHLWGDQVSATTWTSPLQPVGIDPDLGAAFVIPRRVNTTPANCTAGRICLIMHKGDLKDPGPDMEWNRSTLGDLVFLISGSPTLVTAPKPIAVEGAAAHLMSADVVAWNVTDARAKTFELRWSLDAKLKATTAGVTGGSVITLREKVGGLTAAQRALAPHLATWRAFDVAAADRASIAQAVKGQLWAVARAADGSAVSVTRVQLPFGLDDLFATTEPLGPTFASIAGTPTVRLWAPTAQMVKLHVYDAAKTEVPNSPFTMTLGERGVWSATGPWYRQFYRFELTVFHPATERIETVLVTDPYATSLSTNSSYAQFIDLADPALAPAGWSSTAKPPLAGVQDVVIEEAHVRDFSVLDSTVPANHRGRYLAFTDAAGDGRKHLTALAQAGVTHLHLLPVFDIASVDEDPTQRLDLSDTVSALCARVASVPAALCSAHGSKTIQQLLALLPGDSQDQQVIAKAMSGLDAFNWGYDPFHYGVPEGSYASNAEGPTRIVEFRQMVQALNGLGLRVVMDVVYNHTNASGLERTSVLDKVVPGYYHRLDPVTGAVATSTCCANTATEHRMMQRLMVDTLVRWARDYKVDGFRFDLMGHHLKANILEVRTALNALSVAADGVEGSKLLLYGEGWDFGEVANNARGVNATQLNMRGTGVGTFNDRLRDAIRGGGSFDNGNSLKQNQGFATGLFVDPNDLTGSGDVERAALDRLMTRIHIGMAGNLGAFRTVTPSGAVTTGDAYESTGYNASPGEAVSYCAAHDNQTFWDIAQYKLPAGTSAIERARVQNLAHAVIALGQGMPFFHLGEDLLRSKSMERDSYDSGDWFNRLDWTATTSAWKSGLPNAEKDGANWPLIRAVFADSTSTPTAAAIALARDRFRELLRQRKASPLFRLATAADVLKRVDFPNVGPNPVRGLLVMTVSDGVCAGADLDPARTGLVLLINANKTSVSWILPGSSNLTLHPIDAASVDALARTSTFSGGTFIVPGHTTAVFEQLQAGAQGAGLPCNSR